MRTIKKTTRTYYKNVLEQSTPGTYTLDFTENTQYIIELYGGGGGLAGAAWSAAGHSAGGGSGAGFKGIFVPKSTKTITITIGSGGSGNSAYSNVHKTAGNGGNTSFGGIIVCGGGKGGSTANGGGAGGTLSVTDTNSEISRRLLSLNGDAGDYKNGPYAGWYDHERGLSIYDNTHYGYGAGGWSVNKGIIAGLGGYCNIIKVSDSSDYDYYVDTDIYEFAKDIIQQFDPKLIEKDVGGTYTVEILFEGPYNVEMYGAGGGRVHNYHGTDTWYGRTLGGGSGAGFKGVVNLSIGTYTINVGTAGISRDVGASSGDGDNGGDTVLQGIINAGGGKGGHAVYMGATNPGVGGTLQILDASKIVSTSKSLNGNTGGKVNAIGHYTIDPVDGGASVYDNTAVGYGAGGGYPLNAVDGYCKITYAFTPDDPAYKEIPVYRAIK